MAHTRIMMQRVPARDRSLKTAVALCGAAVLIYAYLEQSHVRALGVLWASSWGRILVLQAILWGSVITVWFLWRIGLAVRYEPHSTVENGKLPQVTVVVPAFNEGRFVEQTLRCLARADYPNDRLEIVVVDDGSDDDTWYHIEKARQHIGPRLKTIRFPENRGKRWALWEGFRHGRGDVFVTVDSDSLVEPDALKALVSPIVQDPEVGAVAGNVRVLNHSEGIVPRMLAVRYVVAFDYKRAAQSGMNGGGVLCVAGALAAYRRDAVVAALDKWLHQTFLGGSARAGEDHAMTNFVLKQGYKVVYQRSARVLTRVPTTLTGLAKMFLRWSRSNVRETIHLGRFLFMPFRTGSLLAMRINYVVYTVGLFVLFPFSLILLAVAVLWPDVFGIKLLAASVSASVFPVIFYTWRERDSDGLYGILYGLVSTFLLWWIWPLAILTCNKSVWLTRGSRREKGPHPRRTWLKWAA